MEPVGIFMGIRIDLSKKKRKLNIMQQPASAPSKNWMGK
jgi:hypothetical protein